MTENGGQDKNQAWQYICMKGSQRPICRQTNLVIGWFWNQPSHQALLALSKDTPSSSSARHSLPAFLLSALVWFAPLYLHVFSPQSKSTPPSYFPTLSPYSSYLSTHSICSASRTALTIHGAAGLIPALRATKGSQEADMGIFDPEVLIPKDERIQISSPFTGI